MSRVKPMSSDSFSRVPDPSLSIGQTRSSTHTRTHTLHTNTQPPHIREFAHTPTHPQTHTPTHTHTHTHTPPHTHTHTHTHTDPPIHTHTHTYTHAHTHTHRDSLSHSQMDTHSLCVLSHTSTREI